LEAIMIAMNRRATTALFALLLSAASATHAVTPVQNGIDAQRTKSETTARLRAQAEAKLRLEALTKARIAAQAQAQAQAKAQAIGGRSVFEERKRRLVAALAARDMRIRAQQTRVAVITAAVIDQPGSKHSGPKKPLHRVQSRVREAKSKLGTAK
jgi:hypothetical protein